jgi:hypothetical protein
MASHTKSELREAAQTLAAAVPAPVVASLRDSAVFDGFADAA